MVEFSSNELQNSQKRNPSLDRLNFMIQPKPAPESPPAGRGDNDSGARASSRRPPSPATSAVLAPPSLSSPWPAGLVFSATAFENLWNS
ncbi:hypothetical protein NL676_020856 [Syzygium grande]|nr:hypothetical protein NL676_020856 [Syzygium grande]